MMSTMRKAEQFKLFQFHQPFEDLISLLNKLFLRLVVIGEMQSIHVFIVFACMGKGYKLMRVKIRDLAMMKFFDLFDQKVNSCAGFWSHGGHVRIECISYGKVLNSMAVSVFHSYASASCRYC